MIEWFHLIQLKERVNITKHIVKKLLKLIYYMKKKRSKIKTSWAVHFPPNKTPPWSPILGRIFSTMALVATPPLPVRPPWPIPGTSPHHIGREDPFIHRSMPAPSILCLLATRERMNDFLAMMASPSSAQLCLFLMWPDVLCPGKIHPIQSK